MEQEYNLISFKKYLYQNHTKFHPGGLSVWCNTIPIPVDIFDELFRRSDEFFSLYLDHIFAVLFAQTWINEHTDTPLSIEDLPDPKIIEAYKNDLRRGFKDILVKDSKGIFSLLNETRKLLNQEGYNLNPYSMLKALSHKGKKYSRVYIPDVLKNQIYQQFPKTTSGLGCGNYDMFGNVLADELSVYRIGFSDAFAKIFNRMLDYRILCSSPGSITQARFSMTVEEPKEVYAVKQTWIAGHTTDGALWEPLFDGEIKTRINITHPLYRHYEASPEQQRAFQALVQKLSEYEMNAMNDKQLHHMENLRKDISRELWLEHEMDT